MADNRELRNQFRSALDLGNITEVKRLLQLGAPVNHVFKVGTTNFSIN